MVCPPRPPVQPQPPLQEGRQRLHRAEELDACPQADGLGSLRHPAGRGSHECFVSERAPSVAQSLSAFGEADQESARGLEAAAPLRSSLHASGSAGSWGSRRGYGPHPSRRPPESSAGPGPVRTQPPNRSQAASDLRSRAHAPEPQGPAQGARGKGYILDGATCLPRVTFLNGLTRTPRGEPSRGAPLWCSRCPLRAITAGVEATGGSKEP